MTIGEHLYMKDNTFKLFQTMVNTYIYNANYRVLQEMEKADYEEKQSFGIMAAAQIKKYTS